MADQKLSELTAATTIAANDLFYGVISSNSRRITRDNFCASMGPIVSSGTATATKLVPTGNVTAGNGMYLPATNAVAFSTNGSERMRILADGKVGVNTSAPTQALSVVGIIQSAETSTTGNLFFGSDANPPRISRNSADEFRMWQRAGSGFLTFLTNDAERMRILANGNIGIGTSAAGEALDIGFSDPKSVILLRRNQVSGTAGMTQGELSFGSYSTGTTVVKSASIIGISGGAHTSTSTPGQLQFFTAPTDSTTAVERVRINQLGRVGIGLTAPNELLEVAGNIHVSGGDRTIFNRSNNSLQLGTNNTARLTITAGGAFGFATATPNASAVVDIVSTTQGFLPPRMTGTQRDAIGTPAAGLIVYNTTSNKLNFYNGSAWRAVDDSAV